MTGLRLRTARPHGSRHWRIRQNDRGMPAGAADQLLRRKTPSRVHEPGDQEPQPEHDLELEGAADGLLRVHLRAARRTEVRAGSLWRDGHRIAARARLAIGECLATLRAASIAH